MTNLRTLYQNLLPTFQSENAKKAFLWAADTVDKTYYKYPAERFARDVDNVYALRPVLQVAAKNLHDQLGGGIKSDDEAIVSDVEAFMIRRAANAVFGGNIPRLWFDVPTAN